MSDLHALPPLTEPQPAEHELVPPQDLAAERAVLGAMLTSKAAVTDCVDMLTGRDFYRPAHETIFDACVALHARNEPVDAITVGDHLGDQVRRIGGAAHLFELVGACTSASSAGYYAQIVADRAVLRRLVEAGTSITQLGHTAYAGDVAEVVAQAHRQMDSVTVSRRDGSSHESDVYAAVAALDDTPGIPTPWQALTDVIGGWAPGRVYYVGARPGNGKTLVGVCAALDVARRGKRALICSLEMSKTELYHRMLANVGSVDAARIMHRRLVDADYALVGPAAAHIAGLPLTIDDRSTIRPMDVRATARELARDGELGLVVVDYLQLMAPEGRVESRQVAVAEFSRQLKVMARELEVPIIALSQLNRGTESRTDRRPTISDLRDSGALEQDADVVLLLHRDADKSPGELAMHVGKNRHGAQDVTVHLRWEAEFSRVSDPVWTPSARAV